MQYLLQVIVYTGIMLTVYLLLLKDKPAHQLSRAYLLATTMLPLIMPFITLPEILQSKMPAVNIIPVQLNEVIIGTAKTEHVSAFRVMMYLYVGITILLAALQLRNIYIIRRIINRSERKHDEHYTLLSNTGYGPGSWGSYIFLPNDERNEDIIAHEAAHIQMKHTYDLLLLTLIQALTWPNIFLIIIKRELVLVHEFQADAKVDTDKEQYANLLLSSLFASCTIPMTHSFIVHPIKRRIMMLYKKTNRSSFMKKSLLIASVTGLLSGTIISLQSCERDIKESTQPVVKTEAAPDKMPEFPGNINEFMAKNIKYPKEAMEKKIAGRVVVKFVVDENGNIKDPVVLKSPDEILSQEAIRVVNAMPKWISGEKDGEKVCIAYTLPISFRL